jgi:pimeloyl-ACP methyl ester carboxylesterase
VTGPKPGDDRRAGEPLLDRRCGHEHARIMLFMRRRVLGLLGSIGSICALFGLPVGSAAAQGVACEAMAQQALSLGTFRQAADAYANLLSRPEAASALLVCLQRGNRELAETLMLYQRRLRDVAAVESAFLHYVVNTNEPKLDDKETADLERLARTYRQSLLLAAQPDADAVASCDPPTWTLPRLRCIGQRANRQRYGRDDVVPVDLLDFGASADGYSTRDATWMSEMSALAYWDADLIGEQLRRWGYARIAEIKDPASDTSGFLAVKDQVLVLSFRGTSGFKNFLTDGNIRRVRADWAAGGVHNGFKTALDAVWPQIRSKLGPPEAQRKDIWLTGHSLGAALAQLAALRLTKSGYRVHRVYTFGTPRIGDKEFVADYDRQLGAQSFPHVNAQDVVTRVPPSALGFHATASSKIRQFTGPGHELKQLSGEPPDRSGTRDDWRSVVTQSIRKTTAFLPSALRPSALRSAPQAPPATANLYSASFERGPLDDHGSFEYLFKLVCASIEYDLWPIETRQSNVKPVGAPRN